jgi:hypothetical protein
MESPSELGEVLEGGELSAISRSRANPVKAAVR